ncbi:MAG: hypothetical protein MUD14_27690 [Hydrococcus sp. Prado102]|nr:hypothetical protein [Hydrococcus sp. Prado102]
MTNSPCWLAVAPPPRHLWSISLEASTTLLGKLTTPWDGSVLGVSIWMVPSIPN